MAATYCTVSDVEKLLRWDFTPSDTPEEVDETDVQVFIDQTAGEINAILSSKGVDTDSITSSELLKLYNTLGAACLTESAMQREGEESKRTARFCQQYESALKKLERNPKMLLGDDVSSTDGLARFRSEDVGEKKFNVDNDSQW